MKGKKSGRERKREAMQRGIYTIRFGAVAAILMVIVALFFGVLCAINAGGYFLGWDVGEGISLGTVILFGSFSILGIVTFVCVVLWKIEVNGMQITYRNCIGRKRTFRFDEFDKIVERESGNIIAYKDGRIAFTIDAMLPLGAVFMQSARKNRARIDVH